MEANKSKREGQAKLQTTQRTQAGRLDTAEQTHSGAGPTGAR